MSRIPRVLPLVGVAAAGVLAINALAGARGLPDLLSGAKAFAEEVAAPTKGAKATYAKAKSTGGAMAAPSAGAAGSDAATSLPPAAKPAAICAPTAAELAKAAGLSPAELQVLQNLGTRRGQLDQRETDLNTQLALMAAAEAKVDAKLKALASLKAEIQGLMGQADAKQLAETDRMVKVFEGMKPKDAAPRMVLIEDSVRLPIAAKMKERALSAILAQMPPPEAKRLTESLANRFAASRAAATGADRSGAAAAANVPPVVGSPSKPVAGAPPSKAAASPDPTVEPSAAQSKKPKPRRASAKSISKPAKTLASPTAAASSTAPAKPEAPTTTPGTTPAPAKPG